MAEDVSKINLYDVLGVPPEATEQEIRTAYRKTALKCHPDKNPGDAEAVERFRQLGRAYEILIDEHARAAYDNVRKAKQAAAERSRQLDSKRKKFKDELDAREKAAESVTQAAGQAGRNLEAEIKRLRKEGSRLLEQEQELLREQIRQERQAAAATAQAEASVSSGNHDDVQHSVPCLFVKWKEGSRTASVDGSSPITTGYDENSLFSLFSKYGKVSTVLVSKKKKQRGGGSAMIEFDPSSSTNLVAAITEAGSRESPLEARWCRGAPSATPPVASSPHSSWSGSQPQMCTSGEAAISNKRSAECAEPASTSSSLLDYENLVLRRLRQAEERHKLIEQLKAEESAAMASAQEKA